MKYRVLGKTGLNVSVVGVGTWQFGGEWGKDYTPQEVGAILGKARDCGINLIDTAECYGDHLSESLIGQNLSSSDRENWIIATKFGHRYTGLNERDFLWSPEEVQTQLEDSLRALRTDHIDVFQFHSGGNDVFFNDELWEMLNKQVEAGKIRFLGHSLTRKGDVAQIEGTEKYNIGAVQIYYNRLFTNPEEALFPTCRKLHLGVLARVPLASGFLSGKYTPSTTFPDNDWRSNRGAENIQKTLNEVEEIRKNEVPDGAPMAQWALAWCLQHPAVTCVIPGCKNPQQVEDNARAADLDMVKDNQ